MRGQERFRTALGLGIPDTVPVFLRDLTLGLDESGYTTPEVCAPPYNAEKSARSVISLQRRLGQDAVVGCIHYVGLDAQALGGVIKFTERGIPSVVRHPLEDDGWQDRVEVKGMREEPYRGALRSYELVSNALRDEVEVVCNVEGPMTKAALLRGLERYAIDLQTDPGMAKEATRLSVRLSMEFLEEAAKRGAGTCFLAASTDNPTMFGHDAFREFSLPGVRALREKARNLGMPTVFHPHGIFHTMEERCLVEESIATGVEGIKFAEENDLGLLKDLCRGKVCALGGVNVFTTLLFGPEERIARETRELLEVCAPGGGYIYMCSCSLHRGMPMNHVEAMMRSCRTYGVYR
jgi:uroporphyrinogen-III decarboxylase